MPAIAMAVLKGRRCMFRRIILANDRKILDAGLVESNGRYVMDLEALGEMVTPRTKVLTTIKNEIVAGLSAYYHARVEYPDFPTAETAVTEVS